MTPSPTLWMLRGLAAVLALLICGPLIYTGLLMSWVTVATLLHL